MQEVTYFMFLIMIILRIGFDCFNSITQKYFGKSFQSALSHGVFGIVISLAYYEVLSIYGLVLIWAGLKVIIMLLLRLKTRFNIVFFVKMLILYTVIGFATLITMYSLFVFLKVPIIIVYIGFLIVIVGLYFFINAFVLEKLVTRVPLHMPYENVIRKFQIVNDVYLVKSKRFYLPMNALFTGFLKNKKVLLSDRLVSRLRSRELRAIIIHEIGHEKLKHLVLRALLLVIALTGFAGLVYTVFYSRLSLEHFEQQATLLIMASWVYFSIFEVLTYRLAQRQEYQADAFVKQHSLGDSLISALEKITRYEPEPRVNRLYQSLFYSHPPINQRIKKIKA